LSTAEDLGDGIGRIVVPIPFKGLDWVNCYTVAGDDGVVLLDCGVDDQDGYDALAAGLKHLGHDFGDVHTLVVSHLHPDHVGLAPRLLELHPHLRFVMHERVDHAIDIYNHPEAWGPAFSETAREHGAPKDFWEFFAENEHIPVWWRLLEPPHDTVADGDAVRVDDDRRLEVLYTPGHEIAHICLRDSRTGVLFSGDHVLPRITPYIGWEDPDRDPDPLGNFIDSLIRIRDGGFGTTLPAHGTTIDRGSARAGQILLHHERRLGDTMDEIEDPTTAWDVAGQLFRPNLDVFHKRLAMRETLAHLEYLRLDGKATRDAIDDILHYRASVRDPMIRLG
jgi:glyoxylase-like metal-dependent hydrolase (beta-lactamase superfamily II)